jgi:hypothetical protein
MESAPNGARQKKAASDQQAYPYFSLITTFPLHNLFPDAENDMFWLYLYCVLGAGITASNLV